MIARTTIPIVTYSYPGDAGLPFCNYQAARDKAGTGKALDPERTAWADWPKQLIEWGIAPGIHEETIRPWWIVIRHLGYGKLERALAGPGSHWYDGAVRGYRARFFEGFVVDRRNPHRPNVVEGPAYALTHADAETLWRDKFLDVRPYCEGSKAPTVHHPRLLQRSCLGCNHYTSLDHLDEGWCPACRHARIGKRLIFTPLGA